MDYAEHLRRLCIDDERIPDAWTGDPGPSALDARTRCLVRLGALVAVSATAPSIHREIDEAVSAGADADAIVGVLDAIMPVVGRPRVVTAAPKVAVALGVDLDLLGE
jgi:alkylhydroperoxidase/carboxymuconolactone decarboxylase family protein YurZ